MIGASGAISGVLGAYIILFPHSRVLTLLPLFIFIEIIEVPAIVLLGLRFLLQLVSGVGSLHAAPGGRRRGVLGPRGGLRRWQGDAAVPETPGTAARRVVDKRPAVTLAPFRQGGGRESPAARPNS